MNQYSHLLKQGALEAREFRRDPEAKQFGVEWLESLAERMESASRIESGEDVEQAIRSLARAITDSGPMSGNFAPSFKAALDALQRSAK